MTDLAEGTGELIAADWRDYIFLIQIEMQAFGNISSAGGSVQIRPSTTPSGRAQKRRAGFF